MWKEEDQIMNLCRFCTIVSLSHEESFSRQGLWDPLAHCMDDLDQGVEGLPLVNQGGYGPKGGGPRLGHHPLDFNITGVNLMKIGQKVDIYCGTYQWT